MYVSRYCKKFIYICMVGYSNNIFFNGHFEEILSFKVILWNRNEDFISKFRAFYFLAIKEHLEFL